MKNNEELREKAIRIFSRTFNVSHDEAGLNGVITARFGFFSRMVFVIFAEDEETAKAYVKHQDRMHKAWESAIILMLLVVLGLIYAFLQMVQDNMIPCMILLAICVVAAVGYMAVYFSLKSLDKKIHDDEGHLKVITFYYKKGWYTGVWSPEFLAKHIPSYDD